MKQLGILFNGQGAYSEKMGLDFDQAYPESQAVFDLAEDHTDLPIRQWLAEDLEPLQTYTRYAQPAVVAVSLAIYQALAADLPPVHSMAGLSLGEYSALAASGAISLAETFDLIKARGDLMSKQCEVLAADPVGPYQMAAVIDMPVEAIEQLIAKLQVDGQAVELANFNSKRQTVIAGTKTAIGQFRKQARAEGFRRVIPLKVEGPFHTKFMDGISQEFYDLVSKFDWKTPNVPVISNVNVKAQQVDEIPDLLTQHLTHPVRLDESIQAMIDAGVSHILQIGPGNTIAKLIEGSEYDVEVLVVSQVSDVAKFKEWIGE